MTLLKSALYGITFGVCIHSGIVCSSLYRSLSYNNYPKIKNELEKESSIQTSSNHSSKILSTILTMYSKGCVNTNSFTSNIIFNDPAAEAKNIDELKEAFRALKLLNPQTLDWELHSTDHKKTQIYLWQRYTIINNNFDLFSNVTIYTNNEGKIYKLEDKWKDLELLHFVPFTWCRRINGILSFYITPFMKTED